MIVEPIPTNGRVGLKIFKKQKQNLYSRTQPVQTRMGLFREGKEEAERQVPENPRTSLFGLFVRNYIGNVRYSILLSSSRDNMQLSLYVHIILLVC